MPLTGPQIGRIHKAILAAYGRDELERVLLTCMDIEFDHVVAGTDFSAQVFALVRWANQRGRALELLKYAHEENRTNTGLADLYAEAQTWGAPIPATPVPAAPPPPSGPHQIFLSYSRKDGALKARLLADLHAAGLTAWTDDGLEPGTPEWQRAIEQAIRDCRCLVVLLSPDAKQSAWVNIEVGFASRLGRRIFPVLARGDDVDAVPIALFTTQYVDLRADYTGQVSGKLIPVLRRHLGLPTADEQSVAQTRRAEQYRDRMFRESLRQIALEMNPHLRTPVKQAPVAAKRVSIEFDWVTIPAGEFLMGSDKQRDKMAVDDELPQHSVLLPGYHIARVPVTNAQYLAFAHATGHHPPDYWADGRFPKGKEQHPVVRVSWHDVRAFCAWASKVTGVAVRLPSEAEWEKAARGTDGRIWPWGDELPTSERCNFDNIVGSTTAVGAYPRGASSFGLLDVAGNVFEWTSSAFKPYPYDAADGREDQDNEGNRVLRGGAFYAYFDYGAGFVRCAYRSSGSPDNRLSHIGFRVVFPGS